MPTVHPSQLPGLVTDAGYGVMMESYAQEPAVRNLVFEIMDLDGYEEGFSEAVIVGADEPDVIARGGIAPARTFDQGYRWTCKVDKLAERIEITEEMMRDPNADAKIGGMISAFAKRFGEGFARKKEKLAADVFNKGAYTAGHLDTFDGAYPGHADSHPKFIYDGKPFFAASGNGHPLFLEPATTKVNFDTNSLTSTNLELARILMSRTNAVDEANQKISVTPNVLLVPPELAQTAEVILGSLQVPGSANNDINTLRGRYQPVSWRYLDDTDGWFLGAAKKGVRLYDSGDPMLFAEPKNDSSGTWTIRMTSYFGRVVTDWRQWSAHRSAQS